jgi:hypothetical protein
MQSSTWDPNDEGTRHVRIECLETKDPFRHVPTRVLNNWVLDIEEQLVRVGEGNPEPDPVTNLLRESWEIHMRELADRRDAVPLQGDRGLWMW